MDTPDSTSKRFYVYILVRPDGRPFYVGKGTGRRVYKHESEAARGHNCHKCNVIRKIWRNGGQIQRYIVFETDDEQEAFTYECDLIAMYGRENLTNQTDGGEGPSGARHSPEARAKRSASIRAVQATPEYKANHREAMHRYAQTPEGQTKIRRASLMRWSLPGARTRAGMALRKRWSQSEYREKHTEQMLERWRNPVFRTRIHTALITYLASPEGKEQRRATMKALWQTPDYRERTLEAQRQGWTPEARAAQAKKLSAYLATPEGKAQRSAATKATWLNPETRAKRIANSQAVLAQRHANLPRICIVEGCGKPVQARGLCTRHYHKRHEILK